MKLLLFVFCFTFSFATTRLPAQPAATATPSAAKEISPAPETSADSKKLDDIERIANAMKTYPVAGSNHVLMEGDVVEIKVYQEDELTTHARVDADGRVGMPLLGLIRLKGKTVEQAQLHVRDLLAKDYLQNPEVSLTVVEFAKKRFSIVGEVNRPGFYPFPDGEKLTLLQAIAMAGGFTPFARAGKVTIKRTIEGKEMILQVNAKAMAKTDNTAVLEILPDDSILIPQSLF